MGRVLTEQQISAGGVAFRRQDGQIEVALIAVGEHNRWQLPKGLIGADESSEIAAQREVREEAGIVTELVDAIDRVEYWYYATKRGQRVRYHKFVHFYLLRYQSGEVTDHDHEVNEARWVPIDQAEKQLAFDNEKKVVARARAMIDQLQ